MSRFSIKTAKNLTRWMVAAFGIATFLVPFAVDAACCVCHPANDPKVNFCINTAQDCPTLPTQSTNAQVKSLTSCTKIEDTQCVAVAKNGICTGDPQEELLFSSTKNAATAASKIPVITPKLNVAIPGLTFSTQVTESGGYIQIPFLAQYISAAYKALIGISAVAAAIMIAYGGFLYIFAATGANVRKGRTIIVDAVIGLVLVLGAYTILATVNPSTLDLSALRIAVVKPDPGSYMGVNGQAPQTLTTLNIKPRQQYTLQYEPATIASGKAEVVGNMIAPPPSDSSVGMPTNLDIPLDCPGRNASADTGLISIGGKQTARGRSQLAICSRGKCLTDDVLKLYLEEQSRTGVPAGVLIAQMLTESWNKCIVLNLFNDPRASCGGGPDVQNYNFGGVGCTQRQVPKGSCAHVAFPQGAFSVTTGKPYPLTSCDDPNGPNPRFNNSANLDSSCADICRNSSRDTYVDCGDGCYPQKSHASALVNGEEIWYPSVQCSRKYKNAQDFLDSHLGFVKACMPYNDSVYKFAYCIGASSYAGVTGSKGAMLAEIIERNCLCGSKDATGCKRDLKFEADLANNMIKKRNLYKEGSVCLKTDSKGNCLSYDYKQISYDQITKALAESSKGALTPREFPDADIPMAEAQ